MSDQGRVSRRSAIRLHRHYRLGLAFIQLGYVVIALGVAVALIHVNSGPTINATAAKEALFAIAAGMFPFIALLFTALFLVVQWAHTTFSPRLSLFRDSHLLWHALGLFLATLIYALAEGLLIADRNDVSAATAVVGYGAVAASVAVAAALVWRALDSIQLSTVLDTLAHHGVAVIDELYPYDQGGDARPSAPSAPPAQPVTQSVQCWSSGVLQEIDMPALVDLASAAGGFVRLQVMVGDSLSQDQPVVTVSAPLHIDESKLNHCLTIGVERTFSQDPKYVLRLLADVGARALSPAVNDPTTAVDVLNVVERLLGRRATRSLGHGVQRDAGGTARVLFPTADWDNYVSVGLDEIRLYGTNAIQVCRRLVSLLETLIEEVPETRRPVLTERLQRLQRGMAETFTDPGDRAQAAMPDRQRLGGSTEATP
jgi:uncharacterized membrane protein